MVERGQSAIVTPTVVLSTSSQTLDQPAPPLANTTHQLDSSDISKHLNKMYSNIIETLDHIKIRNTQFMLSHRSIAVHRLKSINTATQIIHALDGCINENLLDIFYPLHELVNLHYKTKIQACIKLIL